jgi:hypothetical protein
MNVTITCAYNGSEAGTFKWSLGDSSVTKILYVYASDVSEECTAFSEWFIYSYSCKNKTVHSLTIKNITHQMHQDTCVCEYDTGVISYKSELLQILVKGKFSVL